MSNLNMVAIAGNLTRDPESRATAAGAAILNFSVAVNDSRKNQQTGEWEDVPNYIDCVCFGNRAHSLAGILRKGMKVTVGGKLRWSQWEDKNGQKRSKVEVVAESIELPPAQAAPQQYAPAPQAYAPAPQQYAPAPAQAAPQQYQPAPQQAAPMAYGGGQYQPAQTFDAYIPF